MKALRTAGSSAQAFRADGVRTAAWAFLLAGLAPALAQVSVNEQADKLEALKIELEQAKRERDRVIAKRWEDRQKDVESREAYNREYDEIKAKLETRALEADRTHQEIQQALADAEEAEAQVEEARVQFLTLAGLLRDRAKELIEPLEKSFPARIPERLQALNALLKGAETKQEAPEEILRDLSAFLRSEHMLTRSLVTDRRGFLRADKTPGEGQYLRLGTVAAAYRDSASGKTGLLLKNPEGTLSLHPFDWSEALPQATQKQLETAFAAVREGREGPILFPSDILLQQNLTRAYTEEEKAPFLARIGAAIRKGGVFMIPILTVPVVALLLILFKLGHLAAGRRDRAQAWQALEKLETGDTAPARKLDAKAGLLATAVRIAAQAADKGRNSAEQALQEAFLKSTPRLERHLPTLAVLAAAAPLLGLLGTVSGLLAMFTVLTEQGVNDPKLLAGGIAEALITTEAGLIVAIPILFAHNWLSNRVEAAVGEAEYAGQRAMNALWPKD